MFNCFFSAQNNLSVKIVIRGKNNQNFHIFIISKGKLSNYYPILVTKATPQFFCVTFTSLNLISEPNNQLCVLGAINEHY